MPARYRRKYRFLGTAIENRHEWGKLDFLKPGETRAIKGVFPNGARKEMRKPDRKGDEIREVAQMFYHNDLPAWFAQPAALFQELHFFFMRPDLVYGGE